MTTIGPSLASLAAARYLDLARSDAAPGAGRLAAALLARGADDASGVRLGIPPVRSEIEAIGARLAELRAALVSLKSAAADPGATTAQRDLTRLVADIRRAEQPPGPSPSGEFDIRDIAAGLKRLHVNSVRLEPGEQRDVTLEITASAQAAGFYLAFGGDPSDGQMSVEIAGRYGARTLELASGATMQSVADAINAITPQTGVLAIGSGAGVRLESTATGSAEFVSVEVISADRLSSIPGAGVFALAPDDATAAGEFVASFAEAHNLTDYGQDIAATVNGVQAKTYGTEILALDDSLGFTAVFGFATAAAAVPGDLHAQQLGSFHIFTLVDGRDGAPTPPPGASAFAPDDFAIADAQVARADSTLALGAAATSLLGRAGRLNLPSELAWLRALADQPHNEAPARLRA